MKRQLLGYWRCHSGGCQGCQGLSAASAAEITNFAWAVSGVEGLRVLVLKE